MYKYTYTCACTSNPVKAPLPPNIKSAQAQSAMTGSEPPQQADGHNIALMLPRSVVNLRLNPVHSNFPQTRWLALLNKLAGIRCMATNYAQHFHSTLSDTHWLSHSLAWTRSARHLLISLFKTPTNCYEPQKLAECFFRFAVYLYIMGVIACSSSLNDPPATWVVPPRPY